MDNLIEYMCLSSFSMVTELTGYHLQIEILSEKGVACQAIPESSFSILFLKTLAGRMLMLLHRLF